MALSWLRRFFTSSPSLLQLREQLEDQQHSLQQLFLEAVRASGKPRGLRWKAIDWLSDREIAREKKTGQFAALVGITISFEAIEGSDMEGLPAVSNLRQGCAVFFYHQGAWHTTGRVIFNLDPREALAHFGSLYDRVS